MGRHALPPYEDTGFFTPAVPEPSAPDPAEQAGSRPRPEDPVPARRGGQGAAPGRRTVVAGAVASAVAGAGVVAFGPSAPREALRGLAADLGIADPPAAAPARVAGPVVPARTASTAPDYQSSTGGTAPAATVTPVKQPPTILALDPALHVARRLTWGPTPTLLAAIRKNGVDAWVRTQLTPSRIADPTVDAILRRLDTLTASPARLKAMNPSREKEDWFYAHTQLEQAQLVRAAWSNRQLFEVVVDFWHSRLHVPGHFDKSRDTLNDYDRTVIRKHALGTFEAMLRAAVRHPAMILYLDNQQNTRDGGNQNLGRELLELHTLGVDAGYTQKDVEGAARLLTGLSVDPGTLRTVFHPRDHHVGRVTVFRKAFANSTASGGSATIDALVRFLARHPKTAHSIATDLVRRFVADAPPKALVARLAKTYLAHGTAITPVLGQLFASPEFRASVGQKYRRPLEHTVATMRALGLRPAADRAVALTSLRDLRWGLEQMGQTPLGHTAPDGYADFAQPWLSTLGTLTRWNMAMALAGGWNKGFTKPDVDGWIGGARTYGAAVDRIAARLLFQKPPAAHRAAALAFLGVRASTPIPDWARKGDYNLHVRVPALLLGGPHHQLR